MHDPTKPETKQQQAVVYVMPSDDAINAFAREFCAHLKGDIPDPDMVVEFAAFLKAIAAGKANQLNGDNHEPSKDAT